MKTLFYALIGIFIMQSFGKLNSQISYNNWSTVGGNSNRDGFNDNFYGAPLGISGSFNAPSTIWGMQIFAFENKIANTRYTSLSPLRAVVSVFTYNNNQTLWTFGSENGVYLVMGFNDNKVYVRDFRQNGNDIIFALNADNGSVIWTSEFTVERGIIWTAVFADDGDLILPGSGTKRIMRINHINGDTVWTNSRIIPNTGAENMCVNGNTLYAWQGGLTSPKTIIAIDINTGITKYSSQTLPGDGDQEIPMTVSKNGVVYCIRDGGLMYALKDNGSGFTELWSRSVSHPVGTYSQIGINWDSSVYMPYGKKVYRLDHTNGNAIDSSADLIASGTMNPRFAFDTFRNVYLGNGASDPSQGKYYFMNNNMQSVFKEIASPFNYYSGPAAGGFKYNPYILFCGAGSEINYQLVYIDNISHNNTELSENFFLNQNFPNPFNPETEIQFDLKVTGFVKLIVYDVLGNEVAELINSKQNSGNYSVKFDGSNFASGIYFYKLSVINSNGTFIETKKMILSK